MRSYGSYQIVWFLQSFYGYISGKLIPYKNFWTKPLPGKCKTIHSYIGKVVAIDFCTKSNSFEFIRS